MKIKTHLFFLSILFIILNVYLPNTIAQDYTLRTLRGHLDSVRSVSFSPDGQTLASGSDDGMVRLWDVNTGETLRTLRGHLDSVRSVSFSPDGQTLASGSWDRTVRLWDVNTGETLQTLGKDEGRVNSVSFSPDGQTLATGRHFSFPYGSFDPPTTVRLWDVNTGKTLWILKGHVDNPNPALRRRSVYFSPRSVSFSPDGQTLAIVSADTTRTKIFPPIGVTGTFTYRTDYTVRLLNVNAGGTLKILTRHKYSVRSVSFSPDGQTLATGRDDGMVRLWDVNTGETLQTLGGHAGRVNSVSFSPDGQTLATGRDDGTLLLWDLTPSTISNTADVNQDGIVNIIDLTLVASNFGETNVDAADVNGDGVVNIVDLTLVAGAFAGNAAAPEQ